MAHDGCSGGSRGQITLVGVTVAATAIGTRIVRAMARLGIRMRRLRSMRSLVMWIIIGRGTLETDSIILRRRGSLA